MDISEDVLADLTRRLRKAEHHILVGDQTARCGTPCLCKEPRFGEVAVARCASVPVQGGEWCSVREPLGRYAVHSRTVPPRLADDVVDEVGRVRFPFV